MSGRNPDFAFLNTDPAELIERMVARYEALSGRTMYPASPERLVLQWVAAAIIHERLEENYAINQNIPSRAEGENLDALAQLYFAQSRTGATRASVTVKFTLSAAQESDVLIPAGTRVTDSAQTLYWETSEAAVIAAGETETSLTLTCETEGAAGNGWTPGQINTIVDVFDYYTACVNTTTSAGGSDAMSDDELYEAMRLSMDALSTAGPRGSYLYHAKSVSNAIADVAVATPSACEVRIYALMEDGTIAPQEVKNAILEKCSDESVRPLTDHVTVEDPDTVTADIDVTCYISTEDAAEAADIRSTATAAVEDWKTWQSGKFGRDVNPSKLIALLMNAGVKRVELRSPTYQALSDGSEQGTTPQIAIIGNETVLWATEAE